MAIIKASRPAILIALLACLVVVLYTLPRDADCAPTKNNNANNSGKSENRIIKPRLLSNLFRRQTGSSTNSESSSSSSSSSNNSDNDEPLTQTELEAQKFVDSLPNTSSNSGPSSFRERISESFGLLRSGVSNQFRSLRENFSDTVDDLKDTWSNSES